MAEVLDGISDVKDVPMPIPGYQWRSDQSATGLLRLINIVMFAHGDTRMTIILRPQSDAFVLRCQSNISFGRLRVVSCSTAYCLALAPSQSSQQLLSL
ncbi:Protein kinase dsk1 [Fusarium oxysporum f. sp. albedinis]|jgi:hypothetical protein|nr:Protein kinase dsk1 [Fusarium oxysporum f. sp. albedinis]